VIDYDYLQFLNEKILDYLPSNRVRIGNKINFRCPICGDSHKSITKKRGWYYLENGSFYCFNCGTGMSGIKFLQVLSGQDYADIKKEYVRLYLKSGRDIGLSSYYEVPKEEPSIFELKSIVQPNWKKPLSDKAKEYLNNRMVLSAPYLREDLFSCYGKNNDEYIMIPWVVNGIDAYYQLNDFQKLHSLKYVFPKDKKKLIYGLDNIDISWPYIIVFEGVYDSLFVKNAIATGTKSITDYQLKLIRDRYPNHQICLSFDNDIPGIASMRKFIEHGVDFKFFKWFNENTEQKDINDYVKSVNNVTAFTKPRMLERLIVSPLKMKLWLIQHDKWVKEKKVDFDWRTMSRKKQKPRITNSEEARRLLKD